MAATAPAKPHPQTIATQAQPPLLARASKAKPKAADKFGGKTVVVKVRRQGGARVMTIPPAMLTQLGADEGTALAVAVRGGKLVAERVAEPTKTPRRRYTLADLLVGAEHLPEVYASVADTLDGAPVGHEAV